MTIHFTEHAWEDDIYWQATDKRKRINDLIHSIQRAPFEGIGQPEPLRFSLAGYWSRRIDREHRLVYRVEDDSIFIAQCRYHYE